MEIEFQCKKCGEKKPLTKEFFYENGRGGFRLQCKVCLNNKSCDYTNEHKEGVAESRKRYREKNKEKIRAYRKAYKKRKRLERLAQKQNVVKKSVIKPPKNKKSPKTLIEIFKENGLLDDECSDASFILEEIKDEI